MKKLQVFGISLLLIVVFSSLGLALRINEVELNPTGSDTRHEWVELYSESEIDLNGWRIENSDGKSVELDGNFEGYFIVNFSSQWLDNADEALELYNGDTLVDSVDSLDDDYNDNRTWQYCDGDWSFLDSSKGEKNQCEEEDPDTENNNQEQSNEEDTYLELEWDESDIQNGNEFEAEVLAFNLNDKEYDLQIYIYDEDSNVMSERYDEEEETWKAGSYFIPNFFSGPGNETGTAVLRMKESYADFLGDAEIVAKIREAGSFSIVAQEDYAIEVLEIEEKSTTETENEDYYDEEIEDTQATEEAPKITGNVIMLGNREKAVEIVNETKEEGKILYESSSELMKKYAIYGLNFILVGIIVFLLISFKNNKNQE